MSKLELCCKCDQPTGRVGKFDDSIFITLISTGDTLGPFCEACREDVADFHYGDVEE